MYTTDEDGWQVMAKALASPFGSGKLKSAAKSSLSMSLLASWKYKTKTTTLSEQLQNSIDKS